MNRHKSRRRHANDADTMLDEYDFSSGVRGQTYRRYAEGSNIVVLDPDVAEAFPTATAVNDALRVLVRIAKTKSRRVRRKKTA